MTGRPAVFLHVGAPKTGTTYLQAVLFQNADALRRDGLLYPARPRLHFLASQDLRDWRFQGHEDPELNGAWTRLVGEVHRFPQRSIVSHESFGSAKREHVDRAMADLDFADVHIVFTARDMARQLPAAWQERVRNRATTTFAEFLSEIRAPKGQLSGPARRFWALHGVPNILALWARTLPPERVHVVTVPPPGSDPSLLWRRFAGVLGVDPDAYSTTVKGVTNSSMGAAEIAVLRRFNEAVEDLDMPWPMYSEAFKRGLAPRLGRRDGDRIELPEEAYDWAVRWAHQEVDKLTAAGYDVAGDLQELIPAARPTGMDPDAVPGELQAEVAIAGMTALAGMMMREAGGKKGTPVSAGGDDQPGSRAAAIAARARQRAERAARRVDWPDPVRRGLHRMRGDSAP